MRHKRQSFFTIHIFATFIWISSFLPVTVSWSMPPVHDIGRDRVITPLPALLDLNQKEGLELLALGTAAAAASKKGETLEAMKERMKKLGGYQLIRTLGDKDERELIRTSEQGEKEWDTMDWVAQRVGLRAQAWENDNKIIIAVRGTDKDSAFLQNVVFSDFGGIFFCGVNDHWKSFDNTSRIRNHAMRMLRIFSEDHWDDRQEEKIIIQKMIDTAIFYKKLLVKNLAIVTAVTGNFFNLEEHIKEQGKKNLINSVILVLNFAACRAEKSPQKQVVFTGHSLGGFIASAAGFVSKVSTVAWNAPGGVGSFLDSKIEDIRTMRINMNKREEEEMSRVLRKEYKTYKECLSLLKNDQDSYYYHISRVNCPVATFGHHPDDQPHEGFVKLNIKDFWVDDIGFTVDDKSPENGVSGFLSAYSKFLEENHSMAILLWAFLTTQESQNRKNRVCLNFEHHKIGNSGVTALKDLTQLMSLNLTDNNIGDGGVILLSGLTNLQYLYLGCNKIGPPGVTALKDLMQLRSLDLSDNNIGGLGVTILSGLTNLQYLNLSRNEIGNSGVTALKNLMQLRSLDLSRNNIGDPGVTDLSRLTNLQCLKLELNRLSLCGFASLNGLINLKKLDLSNNEIKTDLEGGILGESAVLGTLLFVKKFYLYKKFRNLNRDLLNSLHLPNLMELDLKRNTIGSGAFELIARFPALMTINLQFDKIINYDENQRKALKKRFPNCNILMEWDDL